MLRASRGARRRSGSRIDQESLEQLYAPARGRPGLSTLRVTVTGGPGERGLLRPATRAPNMLTSRSRWSLDRLFAPATAVIARICRNESSPWSRHKVVGYLDNITALEEARRAGADDAIMLNTRGEVACSTAGNVFAMVDGVLCTPPPEVGALPGVMRGLVLQLAQSCGLQAAERSLTQDDLRTASLVFVTNSLRGIVPIRRIGSQSSGSAHDPVARSLQAMLLAEIYAYAD